MDGRASGRPFLFPFSPRFPPGVAGHAMASARTLTADAERQGPIKTAHIFKSVGFWFCELYKNPRILFSSPAGELDKMQVFVSAGSPPAALIRLGFALYPCAVLAGPVLSWCFPLRPVRRRTESHPRREGDGARPLWPVRPAPLPAVVSAKGRPSSRRDCREHLLYQCLVPLDQFLGFAIKMVESLQGSARSGRWQGGKLARFLSIIAGCLQSPRL